MNPMLLAVLIFILVTGLVAAVALLMKGSSNDRVTERLDKLVGRGKSTDSSADMLLKQALLEVDRKTLLERMTPEFFKVSKMFEQADISIRPSMLFGISLALAVAGGFASMILVNIYVLPVGAILMFMTPWIWLWWKRASRLKRFSSQLPDAMELVARALRAGHSLAAGLHVVAEEMPDPIAKEFRRVYDEQNLGISLEEALNNLCDRVPNLDLRFFVTSVAIQRQTGGDLAEILDRIGHVIRERFKILGQVKALTAEGRLSGIVLIAMPIGLFLMMMYMKPDYIRLLWTEEMGRKMSIGAIVLMLVGAISIKKIIDIKV